MWFVDFQQEIQEVKASVEARDEEANRLQQEIEEAKRQMEVRLKPDVEKRKLKDR